MSLFHCLVGFPAGLRLPERVRVRYTQHALREALEDGVAHPPETVDIDPTRVVEVEVQDNMTTKVVVRLGLTSKQDLVLVLKPNGS